LDPMLASATVTLVFDFGSWEMHNSVARVPNIDVVA